MMMISLKTNNNNCISTKILCPFCRWLSSRILLHLFMCKMFIFMEAFILILFRKHNIWQKSCIKSPFWPLWYILIRMFYYFCWLFVVRWLLILKYHQKFVFTYLQRHKNGIRNNICWFWYPDCRNQSIVI